MNHFIFDAMFIVIPVFIGIIFIVTIAMMISPKLRGKMMSRQIKSAKYMLDQHEDTLKDLTKCQANIQKEGIEITARAIKEGLSGKKSYCKHCGTQIDKDSKFCKECGKEQ